MTTIRESGVYQLKVTLDGITPLIWRRLLVPASISLKKLHGVLQTAMGWENSHLHQFEAEEGTGVPSARAVPARVPPRIVAVFRGTGGF